MLQQAKPSATDQCYALMRLLADGKFHSGQKLGDVLGVSRSAVWKALNRCQQRLGLQIMAVSGRGYRLDNAIELLDVAQLMANCSAAVRDKITDITVLSSVDSTNNWLQARLKQGAPSGVACIAEHQTSGRGRLGRSWVSPFGANLYLSLLWRFQHAPSELMGLSLAAGVAAVRAIQSMGCDKVQLKWPNDLVVNERKLGGILVEFSGESGGPCDAIIGVGINLQMPKSGGASIDQAWIDLQEVCATEVSRNRLAGFVLDELIRTMVGFDRDGFAASRKEWCKWDIAVGKQVRLVSGQRSWFGTSIGVNEQGALLIATEDGVETFYSGEVSLRVDHN